MKDEERPAVDGQAEFKAIPKHTQFKLIGDAGESEWHDSGNSKSLFVNICGRRIVFKNVKFSSVDPDTGNEVWYNIHGKSEPSVWDYLTDEEISWMKRYLRLFHGFEVDGNVFTSVIRVYSNDTLLEE